MRQDTNLEIFNAETFNEILDRDIQNNGQFMTRVSRLLHWGNEHDVITLTLWVKDISYVDFTIKSNGRFVINGGLVRTDNTELWSTHT